MLCNWGAHNVLGGGGYWGGGSDFPEARSSQKDVRMMSSHPIMVYLPGWGAINYLTTKLGGGGGWVKWERPKTFWAERGQNLGFPGQSRTRLGFLREELGWI